MIDVPIPAFQLEEEKQPLNQMFISKKNIVGKVEEESQSKHIGKITNWVIKIIEQEIGGEFFPFDDENTYKFYTELPDLSKFLTEKESNPVIIANIPTELESERQ